MAHIVVPGFQAITEFSGWNDDCGPCAEEVCLACVFGHAPSSGNMNAIRARDIAQGWFTAGGGNTVHDVFLDATQLAGATVTETTFGTDVDTIHANLKAAILRGNPCVLQLQDATNLPGNERGVHEHFVAVGGIDDQMGYFIANGDEVPFSGAYWVRWPDIASAQPGGLLEFHMPPQPPSGGGTMSLPSGWSDDGQTLIGPPSPLDNQRYPFVGGMRDQAIQLLANGQMRSDDMALEPEQHVSATRIQQTTNYRRLVFEQVNGTWAFFLSNIGAAVLKDEQQMAADAATIAAANQLVNELKAQVAQLQNQPTPSPDPDGAALIALIKKIASSG